MDALLFINPCPTLKHSTSGSRFVTPTPSTSRPSWVQPRSRRARITARPGVVRAAARAEWHALSADEFRLRVDSATMPVCLVGMSNCGKSYWSNQLRLGREFELVSVDAEIEKAIEPELTALGFAGIDGMAEWMGFPSDSRFAANQARYLSYEETITAAAAFPSDCRNAVLDTTGSVIYLSDDTLRKVRRNYLIVHLEASDDMLGAMTENYFDTPKPVVWGDAFDQLEGETPNAALRRCYPRLLRERRERYARLAHVTIPATVSLSRELTLDGFFEHLTNQLLVLPGKLGT